MGSSVEHGEEVEVACSRTCDAASIAAASRTWQAGAGGSSREGNCPTFQDDELADVAVAEGERRLASEKRAGLLAPSQSRFLSSP